MRIPVLSIFILFFFTIAIDAYILADIRSCTRKRWPVITYSITSLLLWIYLIVILCLPRRDSESSLQPIIWMLFSFLSVYVGKLGYLFSSLVGRLFSWLFKIYRSTLHPFKIFGVLFGLSLCGVMWAGVWYTRHHIIVAEQTLESRKIPSAFDGYRMVQISDLHVGTWGNDTTFISNLVDTINNLKPDIIFFTGDIVNRQTSELYPFMQALSRLKAKDGIYSVLGNHDYGDYVNWNNPGEREENNRNLNLIEKKLGWTLLNNERVIIHNGNDSIILIGVENWGEPPFPEYGKLEKAISSSRDSLIHQNDANFKILLSHNPEHWNRVISKETNIDLTLSGHTHAMQTMLKIGDWHWSPAKLRYEQWGGMYERETESGEPVFLYVNTGSGSVGMPARLLNAYPEVTLLVLSAKK